MLLAESEEQRGTGVQGEKRRYESVIQTCQQVRGSPGSSKTPVEVSNMNLKSVGVAEYFCFVAIPSADGEKMKRAI